MRPQDANPHDVAGLLKYFLRSMPEPLFTYKLYDQFLESRGAMRAVRFSPPETVRC
jgi:hypothetical protein